MQHLERYPAAVPNVLGEVDGRHPTLAEFALDPVPIHEGGRNAFGLSVHARKWGRRHHLARLRHGGAAQGMRRYRCGTRPGPGPTSSSPLVITSMP